mmetsp:Transcript_18104/g.37016  ORF Transcript_18104/g.37016 Transcript_18104/m.37016 type:complete len:276 (+) Transcript_18104:134-961(+)
MSRLRQRIGLSAPRRPCCPMHSASTGRTRSSTAASATPSMRDATASSYSSEHPPARLECSKGGTRCSDVSIPTCRIRRCAAGYRWSRRQALIPTSNASRPTRRSRGRMGLLRRRLRLSTSGRRLPRMLSWASGEHRRMLWSGYMTESGVKQTCFQLPLLSASPISRTKVRIELCPCWDLLSSMNAPSSFCLAVRFAIAHAMVSFTSSLLGPWSWICASGFKMRSTTRARLRIGTAERHRDRQLITPKPWWRRPWSSSVCAMSRTPASSAWLLAMV